MKTADAGVTRADLLRWSMASVLALGAHLATVAAYLQLHRPDPPAGGAPVVLVELAALPSAPDVQSIDIPEEEPMEKAEPEPETVTPPEEPPPPPEINETVPVAEPTPPKPAVTPKKPPAPRTVAQARAPNRADVATAAPLGVASAEVRAAQASWRDLLAAHLQRHKRYPESARTRREQGVVVVGFAMDRNGHVLSHRIVRGSGSAELDQEALALLQRAQPLPAFPPAMPQARMDLTVPLQFSLR